MIILAVDPGKTTGLARVDWEGDDLHQVETVEYEFADTCRWLWRNFGQCPPATTRIVAERFIITAATAKKSQAPFSLEVIGVVKYLALVYKHREPRLQTSSDAKNFSTNARLRALGLWHRGGGGHANDALRHAVKWAVDAGYSSPKLILQ